MVSRSNLCRLRCTNRAIRYWRTRWALRMSRNIGEHGPSLACACKIARSRKKRGPEHFRSWKSWWPPHTDNPDGPIRSMHVTQALAALAIPISEPPSPGPVPEARRGALTPSLGSRLRQRPAHDERSRVATVRLVPPQASIFCVMHARSDL